MDMGQPVDGSQHVLMVSPPGRQSQFSRRPATVADIYRVGIVLLILALTSGITLIVSLGWPSIRKYRRLTRLRGRPRYRKTACFLDTVERDMLKALQDMVGPALVVYPSVRAIDLLELAAGDEQNNLELAQRLRCEVVDYAVFDRNTSVPVLVVDLRNPAEEDADTLDRQRFLESVLAAARLPILPISRVSPRTSLQLAETLQTSLNSYIQKMSTAA